MNEFRALVGPDEDPVAWGKLPDSLRTRFASAEEVDGADGAPAAGGAGAGAGAGEPTLARGPYPAIAPHAEGGWGILPLMSSALGTA